MSVNVIPVRFGAALDSLDPIDVFCAGEPDAVRALRRRLHRINGASARAAVRAGQEKAGDACNLFWQAAQLAGAWTFRPASDDALRDALAALHHLYQAAYALERLEMPDA